MLWMGGPEASTHGLIVKMDVNSPFYWRDDGCTSVEPFFSSAASRLSLNAPLGTTQVLGGQDLPSRQTPYQTLALAAKITNQ